MHRAATPRACCGAGGSPRIAVRWFPRASCRVLAPAALSCVGSSALLVDGDRHVVADPCDCGLRLR
eukprot:375889-Prymnesium_polylepis.1